MRPRSFLIAGLFGLLLLSLSCAPGQTARPGEITSNKDFFVIDIKGTPPINLSAWRLEVKGKVANPMTLSHVYLESLPQHSEVILLQCVEGPSGRAKWTGVRLKDILDLARPRKAAKEVVFYSEDGYSTSITLEDARRPDVLLCLKMNDERLPRAQGYPLRAVVPGKFGYKWAKWIKRIDVVDYDYKGYWESRGWDDEANI